MASPIWYKVPMQYVNAGETFSLDLTPYVYDEEDAVEDLTIEEVSGLSATGLTFDGTTISGTVTSTLPTGQKNASFKVTDLDLNETFTSIAFWVTATQYDSGAYGTVEWKFHVDWDNDGLFDDADADITPYVSSASWRQGMRNAYQLMADEIDMSLELVNTDKRFTPENTSSPYYPNLKPHRRLQILLESSITGSLKVLWRGWIELPQIRWSPEGASTGKIKAKLIGSGPKRLFQQKTVNLNYRTEITGDVAITDTLLQSGVVGPVITGAWVLGLPGFSNLGETTFLTRITLYSDLDEGVITLDYFGDDVMLNAYDVISEVTKAERGRFFSSREGWITWWNRRHLLALDTDWNTIQSYAGFYKPVGLTYQYGKSVKNIVRVVVNQRRTESSEQLWALDAPVTIPPGESRTLTARLRKSTGQFAGSQTLSPSYTFSSGSATVSVIEQGGKAQITIDNSGNSVPAVLATLTLSGSPTTKQDALEIEEIDVSSLADFGPLELSIDMGMIANYNDAYTVAQYELNRLKDARGEITTLEYIRGFDDWTSIHQIEWEIGRRVGVDFPEMDHSGSYFIIGEEHEWGGGIHKTRYNLEPAQAVTYWTLGVPGKTELNETTILAY